MIDFMYSEGDSIQCQIGSSCYDKENIVTFDLLIIVLGICSLNVLISMVWITKATCLNLLIFNFSALAVRQGKQAVFHKFCRRTIAKAKQLRCLFWGQPFIFTFE